MGENERALLRGIADTIYTYLDADAAPDPVPVPVPDPAPAPDPVPVPVNPHAHFDALRTTVLSAWALRSDAEIHANNPAKNWNYDTVHDAAVAVMQGDNISFATNEQVHLRFARPLDSMVDDYIAWQCEFKYGAAWTGDMGALTTHKALRLDDTAKAYNGGVGDERLHEIQMRYAVTGADVVAVPTLRTYACTNSPSANQDPLRASDATPFNWQPGGECFYDPKQGGFTAVDHMRIGKPFLILPDRWVRVTYLWERVSRMVTLTMADADHQAVTVVRCVSERSTGRTYADMLRLLFNSSQEAPPGMVAPHPIYVRNVLVDNWPIPVGVMSQR